MVDITLSISLILIAFGQIMCFFRFYKEPDLHHRLMVIEVLTLLTLSMIVIGCIGSNSSFFFDVVVIGSLIPFLGSIMVLYLQSKHSPSGTSDSERNHE
jgi:multisubunit Na+/H+ antiporter MnhF subunit